MDCLVRISARQKFDGDVAHRLELLMTQWCGSDSSGVQILAGWRLGIVDRTI